MDANLSNTKDLACWRSGIGQYAALLMFMLGVAGLASAHIFYGRRTGIGWRPGRPRFLILGVAIPIVYTAAAYALLILTGGVGTKSGVGSWLFSPSGFATLVGTSTDVRRR